MLKLKKITNVRTWDRRPPACAALCKEPQRTVGGAVRKQNHKICCTFSFGWNLNATKQGMKHQERSYKKDNAQF